jgi:hypothetical protein
MIRFKCAHCDKLLAVKDALAGKRGKCPSCNQPILVPVQGPIQNTGTATPISREQIAPPRPAVGPGESAKRTIPPAAPAVPRGDRQPAAAIAATSATNPSKRQEADNLADVLAGLKRERIARRAGVARRVLLALTVGLMAGFVGCILAGFSRESQVAIHRGSMGEVLSTKGSGKIRIQGVTIFQTENLKLYEAASLIVAPLVFATCGGCAFLGTWLLLSFASQAGTQHQVAADGNPGVSLAGPRWRGLIAGTVSVALFALATGIFLYQRTPPTPEQRAGGVEAGPVSREKDSRLVSPLERGPQQAAYEQKARALAEADKAAREKEAADEALRVREQVAKEQEAARLAEAEKAREKAVRDEDAKRRQGSDEDHPLVARIFSLDDKDGNGVITLAEAGPVRRDFERIDTDQSGTIDRLECNAFFRRMGNQPMPGGASAMNASPPAPFGTNPPRAAQTRGAEAILKEVRNVELLLKFDRDPSSLNALLAIGASGIEEVAASTRAQGNASPAVSGLCSLIASLQGAKSPQDVYICANAIEALGYLGDRSPPTVEIVTLSGRGFSGNSTSEKYLRLKAKDTLAKLGQGN